MMTGEASAERRYETVPSQFAHPCQGAVSPLPCADWYSEECRDHGGF